MKKVEPYVIEVNKASRETERGYYEWDHKVLHVSEVAWCDSALWYRTHIETEPVPKERSEAEEYPLVLGRIVHEGVEAMIRSVDNVSRIELNLDPFKLDKGFTLRGKIDLLHPVEGGWELVDFKTCKNTFPNMRMKPTHAVQLGIYAKILHELMGYNIVNVRVCYVSKGSPSWKNLRKWETEGEVWEPSMDFTATYEEIIEVADKRIKRLNEIISADGPEGKPSESWMCQYCDWRPSCEYWQSRSRGG